MGYFSNGCEGEGYEAEYCDKCAHQTQEGGCPVWQAHLLLNYAECNKPESILHMLIPRDGIVNCKCRMFYEGKI